MGLRVNMKRLTVGGVLAFAFVGLSVGTASAHVTVKPSDVKTATYQVFTVSVPNEKDIATTAVKIDVPAEIASITPTQKSGWTVTTEKTGEGESAKISSVTWSGGQIGEGLRDEFTFSAKTPAEPTKLRWNAYQTYANGTVVSWDQEESVTGGHGADENKGPFSVTNIVDETVNEGASVEAVQAAKQTADRATYFSIAAIAIALIAAFFATRNK